MINSLTQCGELWTPTKLYGVDRREAKSELTTNKILSNGKKAQMHKLAMEKLDL